MRPPTRTGQPHLQRAPDRPNLLVVLATRLFTRLTDRYAASLRTPARHQHRYVARQPAPVLPCLPHARSPYPLQWTCHASTPAPVLLCIAHAPVPALEPRAPELRQPKTTSLLAARWGHGLHRLAPCLASFTRHKPSRVVCVGPAADAFGHSVCAHLAFAHKSTIRRSTWACQCKLPRT